mmetsp:Transcript_6067/g.18335  ORF Transcript_6067/g.18335 Transcript_6067/m.18335 type:complete len:566 (-) Transcript_6067:265-1962(-)
MAAFVAGLSGVRRDALLVPERALAHRCGTLRGRWRRDGVRMCAGADEGRPFGITTPLFYVNADPHLGSAYTTIAVDAATRAMRMDGLNPVMVTGTDEHGEKIRLSAEKRGVDPKQHCDEVSGSFCELFEKLGIDYDRFIRTTSERHEKVVVEFMERVWDGGDIYKSAYEGLYCTGCEEYKDKKELVNKDECPLHQTTCELRKEENYFFALSKYQGQIEKLMRDNPEFVMPKRSRNEVLGWIDDGLRDFSVSRANNPWGIPVPRDKSQTIYVWFDALLGYISALLEPEDEPTLENAMARGWPARTHVIGKDILRFHAIYWPAMLMSAGLELPRQIYGHGFLTKDGLKMGKALGNTVDPGELVDTFGEDAVRYYFLRAIDFGTDGDYSEDRFVTRVNADLANTLGNLLNRCLNLVKKNCDSTLEMDSAQLEHELRGMAAEIVPPVRESMQAMRFSAACQSIMELLSEANVFVANEEPWAQFKRDERDGAVRCLCISLEAARIAAVLLKPVTPVLTRRIYTALGFSEADCDRITWESAAWGGLTKGHRFPKPTPVFPRLEAKETVASK